MQTRLNININDQSRAAINEVRVNYGVTATEAVRRLIGVGMYVMRGMRDGRNVVLEDRDGNRETVVFTF